VEHVPVLLNEVLEKLDPRPDDFMVDGTVDGGGHAAVIIKRIMPGGTFLGVDWDASMIARHHAERGYGVNERYVHGNYAELPLILQKEKLGKADGLLLDLGFSSEQLESSGRGFSFKESSASEPLLMTYDDSQEPVAKIIRELSEEELADVIFNLGGERLSRRIAKAIVQEGKKKRIMTSGELAEVIRNAVPGGYERGRIDPATRTFQALRIYANDELGNLEKILGKLQECIKPGGRIAIITFHSLEDRIVKQEFQKLAKEGMVEILTKKPIEASKEEIEKNPRSRSAKLRVAVIRGATNNKT
jgi:16S rRNA (cytosine1402-N4)-methyltransferase